MLKDHSPSTRSSSSPAVSDSVVDSFVRSAAELKLTEAEQRLNKHRWDLQHRWTCEQAHSAAANTGHSQVHRHLFRVVKRFMNSLYSGKIKHYKNI